jgi:hypothetical protein
MGWPDYGHDAKFKLPKIFTIQAADLSEFMRKWYGISAQTDDKPFAISDAVNVLRTLRHARESVLEQQRSPPTRSDLVAEAMGLGFQGLQGPLLRSRLNDEFPQYLASARGILASTEKPKGLYEGWPAEADQQCKTRWEEALRSYATALIGIWSLGYLEG